MTPVLELAGVGCDIPGAGAGRDIPGTAGQRGRTILDGVDWQVHRGERWVVIGPNGSGKSTLVQVASLYLHPSRGTVSVLGEQWGRTDVRVLRRRIGLAAAALADQIRPALPAHDVVMTARRAALEPWWHTYDDADRAATAAALDRVGVGALARQTFGTLSSGERQRVLIARALVNEPSVLLLDEPMAGLDLAGREELVATLAALAADPTTPPVVLVTHHLEDVPPGFTHAMLLSQGRVHSAGPLDATITSDTVSDVFGLPVTVERRGARLTAYAG